MSVGCFLGGGGAVWRLGEVNQTMLHGLVHVGLGTEPG